MYKGVLADAARAVFNGRIVVRPGAQKTDAKQSNRNLLLSGDSLVHTRPQLEIHADDVKCTHGATIGRLDDDALFYLRSRGIGVDGGAQRPHSRVHVGGARQGVPAELRALLDAEIAAAARRPRRDRSRERPGGTRPALRRRSDYDIAAVRREFPILRQSIHGKPLVYLDNAASTQKPQSVIDTHVALLRDRVREHPSRRARAGGTGDRGVRGSARDRSAVS